MDKNEVLKILETAKDKNGEVPMRLVRQAFEKLPEPCEDMISRQEAVDALKRDEAYDKDIPNRADGVRDAIITIMGLPTAQPAQDCISRQEAIDELVRWGKIPDYNEGERNVIGCTIGMLSSLPAAQPLLEEFEWCTDCKEYDQKAHCCHRFTKVIRKAVEELKVVRCKDCIYNNECEIQCAAQTTEWFYCGFGAER